MSESTFFFKKFSVKQDLCAMKVGTDGVLLGAWTPCQSITNALDIGTGTGLIALMIAQRSNAQIDAIEIDFQSFKQAESNFKNSKWNNRLRSIHESLQEYSRTGNKFDLIITNPPYFLNAYSSSNKARNIARFSDETLNFDELIECSISMMHAESRLSLILPKRESELFIEKCRVNGLFCQKSVNVYTKPNKSIKRVLMEFGFSNNLSKVSDLYIRNEYNEYSSDYIDLVKEFYLDSPAFSVVSSNTIPSASSSSNTGLYISGITGT